MKKLVTLAVAGLMVAGGALASAPAASAYPAGSDPAIAIDGPNRLAPQTLSAVLAVNYKPGCTARVKFTRAGRSTVLATRVRTISPDGTATFGFFAPPRAGLYIARVKQVKTADCAGFSARTRFSVTR